MKIESVSNAGLEVRSYVNAVSLNAGLEVRSYGDAVSLNPQKIAPKCKDVIIIITL
jgi:hypothetical protein